MTPVENNLGGPSGRPASRAGGVAGAGVCRRPVDACRRARIRRTDPDRLRPPARRDRPDRRQRPDAGRPGRPGQLGPAPGAQPVPRPAGRAGPRPAGGRGRGDQRRLPAADRPGPDVHRKARRRRRSRTSFGGCKSAEDLLDIASRAPVIKLVNLCSSKPSKSDASDVHVQPYEDRLVVRMRIDGVLYDAFRAAQAPCRRRSSAA